MLLNSLKNRLLISTLLPGLLCAIIATACLSYFFFKGQQQQSTQQHQSNFTLLSRYVRAMQVERDLKDEQATVAAGKTLHSLGDVLFNIPELHALTLYDKNFNVLQHYGPDFTETHTWLTKGEYAQAQSYQGENLRLLNAVSSSRNKNQQTPDILFWLDAEYADHQTQLLFYQSLLLLSVLILLTLFFSAMLSMNLIKVATNPITALQNKLAEVNKGDLKIRMPMSDVREFQKISHTINDTLQTLENHQIELQENIDQSHQDIRETLETIEIQNIELDLARKEALQTSRVKSEFLANTSHEIRTPLNGIIGFTRLLLKQVSEPQHLEYLRTIGQSSENLLAIINDILDLSKMEAGKLTLDYSPFNIYNLIEDVLKILTPGAHEKGLEITYIIAEDIPENLSGDPNRIRQILTNLIANAIKFSNDGNIVIQIYLDKQLDGQVLIRFTVLDSGIGISAGDLNDHLFDAFTQTESTYSRQHGGTGLGLAISKKLAQQMGGEIGVESEKDIGSKFWFTLKLDVSYSNINGDSNNQEIDNLCSDNILLFDINAASRQHLVQLLTGIGVRISLCNSLNDILPSLEANSDLPAEQWIKSVVISLPVDYAIFPIDRLPEIVNKIQQFYRVIIHTPESLKYFITQSLPTNISVLSKPCSRTELLNTLSRFSVLTQPKLSDESHLQSVSPHIHSSTAPNYNLLCVDDNQANLTLITTLLEEQGHSVSSAQSGMEAIQLCQTMCFDAIFMDIQMPELDGIATSQRIRALNNSNQKTPIIALTAHALNTQQHELLLAGLDDYLSKPASDEQLNNILRRWCQSDDQVAKNQDGVDKMLSLELSNSKTDLAITMLNMLLDDLNDNQIAINNALNAQNFSEAIELIHKLHGATCYCGVPELKASCKALEMSLAKSHAIEPPILIEFNQQIDRLLVWKLDNDIDVFFA